VSGRVYLMYHELELPNRPLCQDEPGYVRYIVPIANFREQMRFIKDSGLRGLNVSEALEPDAPEGPVITFDDGCETDLISAAPLLCELGFSATFFVTVGFLEQRGYMTRPQLRSLSDLGLEIGSHSLTHPYLTDLPQDKLDEEIIRSKHELEQITGREVSHFSCPGGRWNERVAETACRAGYRSVSTSHNATNFPSTSKFSLGRVAIMRATNLGTFVKQTKGHGLWKLRLKDSARAFVKRVFGNALYDRLRAGILARARDKH
jgi:peptidoglycan/xylan/chitin deacetylase (PgdA/CDA1 family)